MLWITLGFLAKRILPDHALPFLGGAHVEVHLEREPLRRFDLEKPLQLRAESGSASENQIAALKQRFDVLEAELRKEVAEIGHADLTVAADVDTSQQRDVCSCCRSGGGRFWGGLRAGRRRCVRPL